MRIVLRRALGIVRGVEAHEGVEGGPELRLDRVGLHQDLVTRAAQFDRPGTLVAPGERGSLPRLDHRIGAGEDLPSLAVGAEGMRIAALLTAIGLTASGGEAKRKLAE
ncbi:MAG: hypothetical protein ACK4YX_08585, partial [Rhabdaerophilum calidifontis]